MSSKRHPKSRARTMKKPKQQTMRDIKYHEKEFELMKSIFERNESVDRNIMSAKVGIDFHLDKSKKALDAGDVKTLMLHLLFLSVYAGTYKADSSVNVSTYKFPLSNPNSMLEYHGVNVNNQKPMTRREKRRVHKKTRKNRKRN